MLERTNPWGRPIPASLGAAVVTEVATEPWQLDAYWALRRAIFAAEQGLFPESDRDEHDALALPIVAQSVIAGMAERVVGVVRIYETNDRIWYGGRLGVAASHRRFGAIGKSLIEAAVSTAHALGAVRFLATVQLGNVRYFERNHFHVLAAVDVCGRPHRLMEADLKFFPARGVGERLVLARAS